MSKPPSLVFAPISALAENFAPAQPASGRTQPKITRTFQIKAREGLHARPAALLVKTARHYEAAVSLSKGAEVVDAKSILAVLSLSAAQGDRVTITAEGADAEQALRTIAALLEAASCGDDSKSGFSVPAGSASAPRPLSVSPGMLNETHSQEEESCAP